MIDFAAPAAAAFGLAGALIVAQYFLKLRRVRKPVPSTFLWERATVDTRANSPWQRLRPEPLLILQVAAVVAITLALMKPYVLRAGSFGSDIVIVLDASITAQAEDGSQTRFESEIAAARALVADLPQDKSVGVVRMDGRPRVVLAASANRGALRSVLSSQRPGYEQPDVAGALSLAYALASPAGGLRAALVLLRSVDTRLPTLQTDVPYRVETFGSPGDRNLGVDSLVASQSSAGTVTATFRVVNTGSTAAQSDIDVLADGRLEAVEHVSLGARQSTLETGTFLARPASTVEALLVAHDSLPADNATWAPLQSQPARRVMVVGNGDVFLQAALNSVPNTEVTAVSPSAYTPLAAESQDLAVFDGVVPKTLPSTNLLLIGPTRDVLGVRIGAGRSVGPIHIDDDPNGLLRYLSTSDVHVFKARAATVPGWAHAALQDAQGPLMLEGTSGGANGRRAVVIVFDLSQSDLALSLDFPVLVSDLLDWLAPTGFIDRTVLHPGAFVSVILPDELARASIVDPEGVVHELASSMTDQGSVQAEFSATDQPGAYTLRVTAGSAVRLSRFVVDPVLQPEEGASGQVVSSVPKSTNVSAANAKVPDSLTSAAALIVLGVLAAEWLVAMRRQ